MKERMRRRQASTNIFKRNGAEISTRATYAAESVNPQEATPTAAQPHEERPPQTHERKVNIMLKTNSKIVRDRIRAYILSAENVEEFAPEGTPNETYNDKARAIYADFMRYYDGDNRNKYRPRPYQEAFEDWAAGLPAILDTCYYYNVSAVDLLGDMLEETAEERAKYDESDAEHLLTYLIFREISREAMKPAKVTA